MKSSSFKILKILACLLLTITSCTRNEADNESDSVEVVPVEVITVKRGDIVKTLELTGNIQPIREVSVMPDISGKVKRIYVEEGDYVKKGQKLAELDTRSATLQLRQAEAGLAVAQSNFEDASKNWERIKNLYEKGTVAPQQYEKAQLGYQAAEARVKQAQAALNLVKHQLEVSVMKAPFDGFITGKYINEGEMSNPMMGGRGIVSLMDLSSLKITASIPEKSFTDVKTGLHARITVDSYPGKEFTGKISKMNPTADQISRSFAIEIEIPNPDLLLRAGMFARINLILEERKNTLTVPIDCILSTTENPYVFVIENNTALRRHVTLGLENGATFEILDGLRENEQIVVTGKEMLRDGSPVRIAGGDVQ